MTVPNVVTILLAYLLPLLFFVYMAIEVLQRNAKGLEHRLIFVNALLYILLFLEELVRHLLPLTYSPALVALWFANVGIMIPGLGFHFVTKFSGLDKRLPRYWFPALFYLPLAAVLVNIFSRERVISSSQFVQDGVWKYPVFNQAYYIALTVSIVISCSYLIILFMGKRRAQSHEHKKIFNLLTLSVILCTCWHIVFGYFQIPGMPPFSYIYGGVIWCFMLRLAMIRYDFMNYTNKRYEKLFNLNPAAILLVGLSDQIEEANPSARQLFNQLNLNRVSFHALFGDELHSRIRDRKEIKDYEMIVRNGTQSLEVVIDGGWVSVENEPHMILIVRDVTEQKKNEADIRFLAYHDPLTRLPNRRYFYEKFQEALQEAEDKGWRLTVILIDLDKFKQVNDRFGHEAGDEVLRHAANHIQETAEGVGMAARLGGDEFVLFIRNAPSVGYIEETIAQLQHRSVRPLPRHNDQSLPLQMSIGVSHFPDDGSTGDSLLMHADKAMYAAKRSARSFSHFNEYKPVAPLQHTDDQHKSASD